MAVISSMGFNKVTDIDSIIPGAVGALESFVQQRIIERQEQGWEIESFSSTFNVTYNTYLCVWIFYKVDAIAIAP